MSVFLTSGTGVYLRPSATSDMLQDMLLSVFLTVVPPLLNPLICSLRTNRTYEGRHDVVMFLCSGPRQQLQTGSRATESFSTGHNPQGLPLGHPGQQSTMEYEYQPEKQGHQQILLLLKESQSLDTTLQRVMGQ
ncbi:Olfactory receptor 14C36 [Sciurus carolinensis]|uniref:Olfactory receptor 14C36 n=1 Tax=Sciurus carolinensis TaxID=30640 RepID=A0AA41NJH1_SCICA|nr:Olfactory receptor 14C36 [Sciurus carolinensis]